MTSKNTSLTDQVVDTLTLDQRAIYEALVALEGIMLWATSGKNRNAESYTLAMHQCAIAAKCCDMALDWALEGQKHGTND